MKRFDLAAKRLKDRLAKVYDRAVVTCALRLRAFPSTDEAVAAGAIPTTVDRFNDTAKWLDELFGGFGLRLEQTNAHSFRLKEISKDQLKHGTDMLWRLCGDRPELSRMDDLDWMLDLLRMMAVKPGGIEWEAGARQGAWNTRLRKTKANIAAKQDADFREKLIDLEEDQQNQRRRLLGMKTKSNSHRGAGSIEVIDTRRQFVPDKPVKGAPVTSPGLAIPASFDPETK
jgi:hypothetical protein